MMNAFHCPKLLAAALLTAGLALIPGAANAADVHGEIVTAATHADLASRADTIETIHAHLHHAVNCLVGPNGAGFDAKEMNPCANSGAGAIPDTARPAGKKPLEAAAAKALEGIKSNDPAAAKKSAAETAALLNAIH